MPGRLHRRALRVPEMGPAGPLAIITAAASIRVAMSLGPALPDEAMTPVAAESATTRAYRKFKRPFRRVWRVRGGRAGAGWGSDRRSARWISAARGPAAVQPGAISCRFPAAGRAQARGAWPHRGVFPFSPSAAGRSRGFHRRRTRCRPVVCLLPRAVLLEVGEDGADGG